jgi:hypothetical protein
LTRCRNGIVKRSFSDLAIKVIGDSDAARRVDGLLRQQGIPAAKNGFRSLSPGMRPEVEVMVLPGAGRFSTAAEYRLLILLDEALPHHKLLEQANMIVSAAPLADLNGKPQFALSDISKALDAIA